MESQKNLFLDRFPVSIGRFLLAASETHFLVDTNHLFGILLTYSNRAAVVGVQS